MVQEMLWEGEKEELLSSSRSFIYNQLGKCLASLSWRIQRMSLNLGNKV